MNLKVSQKKIVEFCLKNHIRKLAFFGSILRDDFGPDSDVDVLVEFKSGHVPGFIGLAKMERELSAILEGRKVDMRTPQDLSKFFRQQVVSGAKVQYAA
jgi:predicted nucleotidyltransferase